MASFVRISVLVWADILTGYAMFVMMPYLTNVWSLTITDAATIVNVFNGVATIMPIGMSFLVDTFMGDYWMLLLSSIAYSFGMSSLAMSTPPVLSNAAGNCGEYKPECIGDAQKVLFYTALALIAIGVSGHITSLGSFLNCQKDQDDPNWKRLWRFPGAVILVLLPIVACIALPYIKPWSVRFGIPAICTVVATFLFLSGCFCSSYKHSGPQGSPLTTVFRVFVASASKMFRPLPHRPRPHTQCLRFLDKAAIIDGEVREQNRWKLCRPTEVLDTKIFICMIPMWMTFIMCGVVLSIGNTYFLEQANNMNRKVGKLKVPLPIFKFFYDLVKEQFKNRYVKVAEKVIPEKKIAHCGMIVAMLFSIVCCITAAGVETRRLDVIRRHGLLDKPNETIPMSMFVLLPQFLFLGALDGVSNFSIDRFFTDQAPTPMTSYSQIFSYGVIGAGTVGSVLSVYVVGKASESGGKPSWFQDTLNKSRLDNYYWTLAALSSINLVLYILVAQWYTYKDHQLKTIKIETENEESTQP
uniref:Major facilitator superfamily (MFS) profile domain-containing protein n=1 Tax=Fagus sylvatica TaxID=28930 RepID=A0A2N9GXM9_FAGSY